MRTRLDGCRVGFSGAASVAALSFGKYLHSLGYVPVGHDASANVLLNPGLVTKMISPPVASSEYLPFIVKFVENECDLYIPFIDDELEACHLAAQENSIFSLKVPICSMRAVQACQDKKLLKTLAESIDIPVVPNTNSVPAFIKPRRSSGGKSSLVINSQPLLNAFIDNGGESEYMIEEYIEGSLVSVDSLWDRNGHLLDSFYRVRPSSAGVSSYSAPCEDRTAIALMHRAIRALGSQLSFHGMTSTQFLLRESQPFLLEVNSRMGGSAAHSHYLGSNVMNLFFAIYMPNDLLKTTNADHHNHVNRKCVARFFQDFVFDL